jgi:hypothetical protein
MAAAIGPPRDGLSGVMVTTLALRAGAVSPGMFVSTAVVAGMGVDVVSIAVRLLVFGALDGRGGRRRNCSSRVA